MMVKAKKLGYYDLRRRPEGSVFELAKESDFSKTWMVKLEGVAPKEKAKKPLPKVVEAVQGSSETEVI